jgi:predicted RNA-binding Zn-ribbon protein involved in translation (DUF1610 family)
MLLFSPGPITLGGTDMVIRLGCPRCGEVELSIHDVRLEVPRALRGGTTYHFGCPACGKKVTKSATPRIMLVLKAHGVVADTPDAPPDPSAPALTTDDLLDFHLWLQTGDIISAASTGKAGPRRAP